MAVDIYMSDGKPVTVTGTLGEVQQHLISGWSGLAEFELEDDEERRVLVNTQQIVSVREHVPSTVTAY
jgi:hypothetical protein